MIIHTVSPGETLFTIARKYAVSPVKIIENNCLLYPDRLIPGQQLLILTPTRTYVVRGGDTVNKVCRRFGIKKNALLASNPALHGRQTLHAGTELALHYDAPLYGICTLNGYVYEGTSTDRFYTLLPYLTYITFCGKNENNHAFIKSAKEENKIPLLRLNLRESHDAYLADKHSLIKTVEDAKKSGFGGITLSGSAESNIETRKDFSMEVKKQLLGMDMLLFMEVEQNSDAGADVADGIILLYEKVYDKEIKSFEEGEKHAVTNHSKNFEPGKTFLEFPSFGYDGEKALTHDQIQKIAIKYGADIKNETQKKICALDYTQYKNGKKHPVHVAFESLENIKAKLELLHEFGLIGAMVDVGRVPISYIMMLYTMFASVVNPPTGLYTL